MSEKKEKFIVASYDESSPPSCTMESTLLLKFDVLRQYRRVPVLCDVNELGNERDETLQENVTNYELSRYPGRREYDS